MEFHGNSHLCAICSEEKTLKPLVGKCIHVFRSFLTSFIRDNYRKLIFYLAKNCTPLKNPENERLEIKNHPIEKGKSSEPSTSMS